MIKSDEAKEAFIKMLDKSSFSFDSPDPKLAWETFKDFFNTKVDCADDALLFQCGVYSFTGEDLFHFGFVRQFIFEEDGEYEHMEQLELVFYYQPNSELLALETEIWSYACNSINEFFSRVENMDSFKVPIEKYIPIRCEIEQEQV